MIVVIVNVSSSDGSLISGPDIITRGFIYVKESEELMRELKDVVLNVLNSLQTAARMTLPPSERHQGRPVQLPL